MDNKTRRGFALKILFVNKGGFDYCQDFLFSGLCKVLGGEAIIEAPWNKNYHIKRKPYPKNLGLQKNNFLKSIKNSLLGESKPDLVILSSCNVEALKVYRELMDKLPDSVPRFFLDGGDWPEVGGDFDRLGGRDLFEEVCRKRPFDVIFKREKLIGKDYPENVFPFPMCFNLDLIPHGGDYEKKYDVAFWGVESHPVRSEALGVLENRFDCRANGTEKNQQMSKYKRKGQFYLEELKRTRLTLNFRGAGWDTLRYWEVPALGAFMLSQKPEIEIENNFVDGEHLVFIKNDLSDLIDVCEHYLDRPDLVAIMGEKASEHLRKFHTDEIRARYVLSKFKY